MVLADERERHGHVAPLAPRRSTGDRERDLVDEERLEHEVERALADRRKRGIEARRCGHHDDLGRRVTPLDRREHSHVELREDDIEVALDRQRFGAARGKLDDEAVMYERSTQKLADSGIGLGDEDASNHELLGRPDLRVFEPSARYATCLGYFRRSFYNRAMASYEKRTWWSRHQLTDRLAAGAFLEAAVTTAFLVAASDGSASEAEYDALLDRLEILGGVDRDKIDELLTAVSNHVESTGFEPRIARLTELVTDTADATAALMLGLAIALADDELTNEEREIAGQIAKGMGLADVDLDAMVTEIRG